MAHNSVSDMLRDIGDNEAAEAIDVHSECHDEIAQQAGRIAELEAQLARKDRVVDVLLKDMPITCERCPLMKSCIANTEEECDKARKQWAEAKAMESE
jgi:hypothetical protein